MASMMTVEGRGALPAGTYKPTAGMGRRMRSQRTPGMTSSAMGWPNCSAWKARTLAMAWSSACRCTAVRVASAASNSCSATRRVSNFTRSKRSAKRSRAASPSCLTSRMIDNAKASTSPRAPSRGRSSAACRPAASREFQSTICIMVVNPASSRPAAPAANWLQRPSGFRGFPRTRSRGIPHGRPPCRWHPPAE